MTTAGPNLVLMGLRGSGKSSIGRALAALTHRRFVDLDDRTAAMLGAASAADALRASGEPAFRAAEVKALIESIATTGQIIALGGGTPTAPGAESLLRDANTRAGNTLVYLYAPAPVLRTRLAATDILTRPALLGEDPLSEIETLFERRDPLYRSLADSIIDTSAMSVEVAARQILAAPTTRA